jgi:hypothetical protein
VNGTLNIGDLTTTPLRDIVWGKNARWRTLLAEQMRGQYRDVCRTCDYYGSVFSPAKERR